MITLVVDGVEVQARDGEMLVDAAKGGDVEIPVFCYEPKLGGPVGACRMCLVEIEGIPKLQTGCSTPVRDGMVVYTRTDRVIEAQRGVVEFLLVNHPLDCPVCDKGGECPLQDIALGWGPGRSRVTEPKRHFRKPMPLSPLVRIDRERCILCYRCVRFSQDVAEDEQLQLLERGASTYVGTFDDHPYIAPFHGNIIELCPVGALTSEAYRFRARPWDIEDSGSICTLCPSQCNIKFTVRDERVERVLARDNEDVDAGWLCDKGRFGFQMIAAEDRIVEPRVGGSRAGWDAALDAAAERLRAAGPRAAAIVGGQASNEEGYLVQRIVRTLGSPSVTAIDELDASLARDLGAPELAASVGDLDTAESILVLGTDPLNSMPILDLRIRRAVRHGRTRLVVASERPSALDGGAEETARYAPGESAAFLTALAAELGNGAPEGEYAADAERVAGELRPGKTVIVYGERLGRGAGGDAALAALHRCARELRSDAAGAGLIGIPEGANGRGLREVGCLPGARPGFAETEAGRGLAQIKEGLLDGELDAVILLHADPVRYLADGPGWAEALRRARTVIAISAFDDASTKAADIVLPAEEYAEKEGTVTHPDGRVQRLRPAVPHVGDVHPIWQVLAELSARLGDETGIDSAPEALEAIAAEVPFYRGITPEEIGGTGVRWPARDAATGFPRPPEAQSAPSAPPAENGGGLRLGTYRALWADAITERNVALRFLAPAQTVELAPSDGERLGVSEGDEVEVRSNGSSVRARVELRERMRPGAAFLIEATATENSNVLGGASIVEIARPAEGSE